MLVLKYCLFQKEGKGKFILRYSPSIPGRRFQDFTAELNFILEKNGKNKTLPASVFQKNLSLPAFLKKY